MSIDVSNLELLNEREIGNFSLDEWIEYKNKNEINTDKKLDDKTTILTNYPRIKSISVHVKEYKKNSDTGIRKITYTINESISKKTDKTTVVKNESKNVEKSNLITERPDWRHKKSRNSDIPQKKENRRLGKSQTRDRGFTSDSKKSTESEFRLFNVSEKSIDKMKFRKIDQSGKTRDNKKYTLVVKSIPNIEKDENVTKNYLNDIFSEYGEIRKIDLISVNGRNLIGFIDFYKEDSVKTILSSGRVFRLGSYRIDVYEKKSKQVHM